VSVHEMNGKQILWVSPGIRKFKNISNLNDYVKVVSRDRGQGANNYADCGRRLNMIKRIFSWSRSDKLALAILLIGVAAFIVTTVALLMAAGLLAL
jgi:hypothetical protein